MSKFHIFHPIIFQTNRQIKYNLKKFKNKMKIKNLKKNQIIFAKKKSLTPSLIRSLTHSYFVFVWRGYVWCWTVLGLFFLSNSSLLIVLEYLVGPGKDLYINSIYPKKD